MNVKKFIFGVVLLLPLQVVRGQDKIVATLPIRHWQVGFQFGGAHLLPAFSAAEQKLQDWGVSESQADKYVKHLKNGLYVSADAHYWFNNQLGAGLKYSLFSSSADIEISFTPLPSSGYRSYHFDDKEQVYVNYVGPSLIAGQWLNQQHTLQLTEAFSIGYTYCRDEVVSTPISTPISHPSYIGGGYVYGYDPNPVSVLVKEGTLGGNLEIALAYYPLPELSVTVNAGFFYAKFKDWEFSTLEKYQIETKSTSQEMSRLNAAIGLQIHF